MRRNQLEQAFGWTLGALIALYTVRWTKGLFPPKNGKTPRSLW